MNQIDYTDFSKVDIRTGTIVQVELFPQAKKPAYKLAIDFGALGIKKSSAQITHFYTPETLIGKQIVAVVNFPPKQIANFFSECLVLGVTDVDGHIVLLEPEQLVVNGLAIS
jgi:tRNA-binding protein